MSEVTSKEVQQARAFLFKRMGFIRSGKSVREFAQTAKDLNLTFGELWDQMQEQSDGSV